MSMLISLTFLFASAASPGPLPSPDPVPAPDAPVLHAGVPVPFVLALAPQDRGGIKVGKGRGFSSIGRNRGLSKMGSGRGFSKMGTGRGMAKVGTGRGFAKIGKGRPMARLSTLRGGDGEDSLPGDDGFNETAGGGKDSIIQSQGDTTVKASNLGNARNALERPPASSVSNTGRRTPSFGPQVQPLINEGDRLMAEKDYASASRSYFAAQQAQGFRGEANLRMAGALMGMGRYTDAVSYMRYHVQDGGRISMKAFSLPEDKGFEQRLDRLLELAPYHHDYLITAAVYARSRDDVSKARKHLETLRLVNPYHPCLESLEKLLDKEDKESPREAGE